ncbi:MAG: glycoside hydrolase family 2 protein [Clostridia bacterium]|nr:glycoside hydrolase family 2 protein [Clostridia bacterium]
MISLNLGGCNWKMRRTDETDYIPAKVPGSVNLDLLNAGKIPDPFYRENEFIVQKASEYDYEYETVFTVDADMLSKTFCELYFKGLDTLCEVYVNSVKVASTNNMHREWRVDVKSKLVCGENDLRIVFLSPIQHMKKRQEENYLWGSWEAISGISHIRKAHSMSGWDWGPQIPDAGVYRDIYLNCYDARLGDIDIRQAHSENKATITADVKIVKKDIAVTAKAELFDPDGSLLDVRSFSSDEKLTFDVNDPKLWYIHTLGAQPLYKLVISLSTGETKEYKLGLREFHIKREDDEYGQSFTMVINGIEFFAMGANYIPEDAILSRRNRERTEKLLKDAIRANHNMVRIWGGGHYLDDWFYELCDQLGLILWHDFMFACAVYDTRNGFLENVLEEVKDNVLRLKHHACIGMWCGNNENETAIQNWNLPLQDNAKEEYLKLFAEALPQALSKLDPDRLYWSSSPTSHSNFEDCDNANYGDAHYWSVWHGMQPYSDYKNYYFRFLSEFGFESFPDMKTIATFAEPEDYNIFSPVMDSHQKCTTGNQKIAYYLANNYRYPYTFEGMVYASQMLQAEAVRAGVEHLRRNRGRCMGTVYWQLNDCWPVASWSSIDYYGRWKALHYFSKRFFAPVSLTHDFEDGKSSFYLSSESLEAYKGKLHYRLRTDEEVLVRGSIEVGIAPLSAKKVHEFDVTEFIKNGNDRKVYLEYYLDDGVGYDVALYCKTKHFSMKNTKPEISVNKLDDRFEITLTTKTLIKNAEIYLDDADFIADDNFVDVVPGYNRVITIMNSDLSKEYTLEDMQKNIKVRCMNSLY